MPAARFTLAFLLATVAIAATACGGGSDSVPSDAVAVVSGTEISKADLDELMTFSKSGYKQSNQAFPKAGTPEYQNIQTRNVAYLVELAQFRKAADDLGLTVSGADVDKIENQTIKEKFGGKRSEYEKALKKAGFTPEQYRDLALGVTALAPEVEKLTVLQRTPIWCLPKPDARIGPGLRRMLGRVPGAQAAARALSQIYVELNFPLPAHFHGVLPIAKAGERAGLRHLRAVRDPEVREKLTPRYGLGCKRPSFSNEYLPAFNRPNVNLETSPIEEIVSTGVRTEAAEHEVDVLILATGFRVFDKGNMPPYPVRGSDGVELGQWWDANRFQAYEGVSVPGFPNMFMILGPYGFNGASYFTLIENQARHIVRCLRRARSTGSTAVEVRPEANRRYFEKMLSRRDRQVFFSGTCATANSYYFDSHGDAPFRASPTLEVAWRSAHFDLDDYRFTRPRDQMWEATSMMA